MKELIILMILISLIQQYLTKHPTPWNFLVFAQQYPPAVCAEKQGNHKCKIPVGVNGWTIHGLWPSEKSGSPSFCNSSWPFSLQSIKPIVEILEVKWPNLFPDTSETAFWKHEWAKHGTCASSVQRLKGELKYFGTSVKLHDNYNIYNIFRRYGFSTSITQPILLKYLQNALEMEVKKKVSIHCENSKHYPYALLSAVYFCFNKTLELIDCEIQNGLSCNHTLVMYLPYPNATNLEYNEL